MKESGEYIDRVVLKLRREYGKDELVAFLNKQMKEKDFELGVLKSEVDHLESVINGDSDKLEAIRKAKDEAMKDELYSFQKEENKRLKKEVKSLKKLRDELFSKNVHLKNKLSEKGGLKD